MGVSWLAFAAILGASSAQAQSCVGDCAGTGMVTISDLILGVNIALGIQSITSCPAFGNLQGEVDIAQLIKGVTNALNGCPAPNLCNGSDKPCYFLAIRLIDQRAPNERPVVDNLAKHLKKLKENTSPAKVFVYPNPDIHISIQLLTQTSPLPTAEQSKLDSAMAAVRSEYKGKTLNICQPVNSGKFRVQSDGYIVYRMTDPGSLTDLMKSVIRALDARHFDHDARQDFPDKGHYSVGNYDTKGSALYKDLNAHFKPWNGKPDTNALHYMRPPYCTKVIPQSISLMIRDKNPAGTPPFGKHYRVDKSYPLQ